MAGAGTGDLPWGDPPDQARYVRVIGKPGRAAQAPWRLGGDLGWPDTLLDAGRVGALTVRVASTRGPSHRFYGTVREDAAQAVDIDGRYLAAAVADGAGSVTGSGHAAQIAVRYALHRLHQRLGRRAATEHGGLVQEVQDAIGQADQALRRQWQGPPATTLVVAVLSALPDAEGRYPFAAARVGDSSAYRRAGGGFVDLLPEAPAGEGPQVHTTRTEGLPSPVLARGLPLVAGALERDEVLLLASDGLGTPLRIEEVNAEVAGWWRRPPDPVEFLAQVQFRRKSFDDDRSAVAVWTSAGAPPPAAAARGVAVVGSSHLPRVHPQARPFAHQEPPPPDQVLDAGRAGDLEVRAASVRGARHGREALARHESVGVIGVAGQVVAVVAQGTPTGASFHAGCGYAVRECLAMAKAAPPGVPAAELAGWLAGVVARTDERLAGSGEVPPGEQTALLVAVVDSAPGAAGGYGFALARAGGPPAYRLSGAKLVPVPDTAPPDAASPDTAPPVAAVARVRLGGPRPGPPLRVASGHGQLAGGEALVLASEGMRLADPEVADRVAAYLDRSEPGPLEVLDALPGLVRDEADRSAVVVWAGDRAPAPGAEAAAPAETGTPPAAGPPAADPAAAGPAPGPAPGAGPAPGGGPGPAAGPPAADAGGER